MDQGKHTSGDRSLLPVIDRRRRLGLRWKKEFVLFISIAALVLAFVGGTVAYIVARTDRNINTFQYANVSSAVLEVFDGQTKRDVKISNTGNTDTYIRVAIIVTWQDSSGNIYPEVPDYTMSLNTSDGWFKGDDGYYYYNRIVKRESTTSVLIESCTPVDMEPEGYTLSVEILADAIQSSPVEAVTSSWGVTIADDGTISK